MPLARILSDRMGRGDTRCGMCGQEGEDACTCYCHALSRACWYVGKLGFKTEGLTEDLQEIMQTTISQLSEDQWTIFANVAWGIWRCRNDVAYKGAMTTFEKFDKYYTQIANEMILVNSAMGVEGPVQVQLIQGEGVYSCFSDGSWEQEWHGGISFVFQKADKLEAYWVQPYRVSSPMQAEARALLESIRYATLNGIRQCNFHTDNSTLTAAVMALQPPTETDWRSYRDGN